MKDPRDTFIHRHAGADAGDQHRHQQAPPLQPGRPRHSAPRPPGPCDASALQFAGAEGWVRFMHALFRHAWHERRRACSEIADHRRHAQEGTRSRPAPRRRRRGWKLSPAVSARRGRDGLRVACAKSAVGYPGRAQECTALHMQRKRGGALANRGYGRCKVAASGNHSSV
jgi:hypothetical protein